MAVYKVPQDVEAEDKLIGPFSFRQFIYLIIVAIAAFVTYILGQIFIGLIVIPLPIIVVFSLLALPLRKDQPMETYLVAMIRFFLKPRLRLWIPDGSISLVQVTAPKVQEQILTKDIGGRDAQQRLSYLAQVVDTQGWATRGVMTSNFTTSLNETVAAEAQAAPDVLDNYASVSQSFASMISQSDIQRRQSLMDKIRNHAEPPAATQPAVAPPPPTPTIPTPQLQTAAPSQSPGDIASYLAPPPAAAPPEPLETQIDYNPYPASMHQKVMNPDSGAIAPSLQPQQPPQSATPTTEHGVSPDIIRLANNNDLSISAIAHEAHRLDNGSEEVIISLHDK